MTVIIIILKMTLSHANSNYWSSSCTSKSDKGAGCPALSKHVPHSLILHSEWKTCSEDLLSAMLGEKFYLKRANLSKDAVIIFYFFSFCPLRQFFLLSLKTYNNIIYIIAEVNKMIRPMKLQ